VFDVIEAMGTGIREGLLPCRGSVAGIPPINEPVGRLLGRFETAAVEEVFDLRPAAIVRDLDLLRPIYRATSAYGHFGRPGFTWEATDRAEALRQAV